MPVVVLNLLNRLIDLIHPEELEQLDALFSQNTCESLIQLVQGSNENNSSFMSRFNLNQIYEFVFEYAISREANHFIQAMISDSQILSYLNQKILYDYALKQKDLSFKRKVFVAMANSFSFDLFINISTLFRIAINKIYQTAVIHEANDNDIFFVQSILFNPDIGLQNQKNYLKEWLWACFKQLKDSPSEQHVILDTFFKYLPNEKNQENTEILVLLLKELLFFGATENSYQVRSILEWVLDKYSFSSDEIIQVAEEKYGRLSNFDLLANKIDKNHPQYESYQAINDFLDVEPTSQLRFFLQHPRMLSAVGYAVKSYVLSTLDKNAKELFLNWYIDHEDFEYGAFLKEEIFNYDEKLLARYFHAPHTLLPERCISLIIEKYKKPSILLGLLLNRPYYYVRKEDLISPLYDLFQAGDLDSISLLLKHASVMDILKNYHRLDGDDELSLENRGALMPLVLAWCIKFSDHYKELFLSIPKQYRGNILKSCVPSYIDPNQPTLRAFIIQLGKSDLIEEIGGLNPRLLQVTGSGKYRAYLPSAFQAPSVLYKVRVLQQKIANVFAAKHSQELDFAPDGPSTIQQQANQAAKIYCANGGNSLKLQHETEFKKVKPIILEGNLKSRLHIQGHRLAGKASQGLTRANVSLVHPKSIFSFFTRLPYTLDETNSKTSHYVDKSRSEKACFVLNGRQLLSDNPHINFIVIGPYQFFQVVKTLQLSNGYSIVSDPARCTESIYMMKIMVSTNLDDTFNNIYQKLFELVFKNFIDPMPEELKSEITNKLTHPLTKEDHMLAQKLLDLLHLEWLIPGNIPLKFSYVDKIEYGEKTYNLEYLRQLAWQGSESDILDAIDSFKEITDFPFLLSGILEIARQRKFEKMIDKILQLEKSLVRQDDHIVYYPNEVYQIEALAQLILEDLNNDRVYIHYSDNVISIQSTLHKNSNRSGAHHAEMAKLHFALGIGNLSGANALAIQLNDNLSLKIGNHGQFKSLAAMRDAMLTHEITTLLVSQQNCDYYKKSKGKFHPKTGKGATNGVVALLKEKLFKNDVPYHVTINCNDKKKKIYISIDTTGMSADIASAIRDNLKIPQDKIHVDEDIIILDVSPADLIAKLRQQAIFYEGINVLTEDGRLLLAERHGKGLASAGGHHSNKYSPNDISYGLRSEFGLEFKNPVMIENAVTRLTGIKTISKTGIYLISESVLQPTTAAKKYAEGKKMDVAFQADPDEFVPDSEVTLTLTEMRGKSFYDVMPLSELCHYQLNILDQGIKEYFPEVHKNMKLTIEDQVDLISGPGVTYKVPKADFGKIKLVINGNLPNQLKELLIKNGGKFESVGARESISIDQSPLALLQAIAQLNIKVCTRMVR